MYQVICWSNKACQNWKITRSETGSNIVPNDPKIILTDIWSNSAKRLAKLMKMNLLYWILPKMTTNCHN